MIKWFLSISNKRLVVIQTLAGLLSIMLSIVAIGIAIIAFNSSNEQFVKNSKSSDVLFRIQLRQAEDLNDSLVKQISRLQQITKNQLEVSNEQLTTTKETLKDQIMINAPELALKGIEISDTGKVINNKYSPRLEIFFTNQGRRAAYDAVVRTFVLPEDMSEVRFAQSPETSLTIQKDDPSAQVVLPKLDIKSRTHFYLCVEFVSFDKLTSKMFTNVFVKDYKKLRSEYGFAEASFPAKRKVFTIINDFLLKQRLPPIKE